MQPRKDAKMSENFSMPSEITTQPRDRSLTTGPQHGVPGSAMTASTPLKTALGEMDSDQVRREVTLLVEQRWPSLKRTINREYELTGFTATRTLTETEREEARAVVRALTRPSDKSEVAQEIGRCLSLTKSRDKGEADTMLMIAAMTDELSQYPMDLVYSSLRKWSGSEVFWPSLAEILRPIRAEMLWRKSLASAANAIIKTDLKSNTGSVWNSMSQDRKDRINDALRRAGLDKVIE